MAKIILFNKPFRVLSQFTSSENKETLANYLSIPHVYAAGRLDYDSEGLLLLTDNGQLQNRIAHPKHKSFKTYWAQVEGTPTQEGIQQLCKGITLKDGPTLPAKVRIINEPDVWARTPPIRERANIATTWLEIIIHEGRNRQVRRMTAHIGHPTLRLIRRSIGDWSIKGIAPGEYMVLEVPDPSPEAKKTNKQTNKQSFAKKDSKRPYSAKSKFGKMRPPQKR